MQVYVRQEVVLFVELFLAGIWKYIYSLIILLSGYLSQYIHKYSEQVLEGEGWGKWVEEKEVKKRRRGSPLITFDIQRKLKLVV